MLIACVLLALTFDFLNGFHDSASLVATVISTRAMAPRRALLLAAAGGLLGPFLLGVAVARAIGGDLLDPATLDMAVILAALVGAILWGGVTWLAGIPSSSSHALVGGLIGAALLTGGWEAVRWAGLGRILVALTISPPLGLAAGYLLTRLIYWLARSATPSINQLFRALQVVTALGLSISHGANDAQKTMGVITLALVLEGALDAFAVPFWVVLACASALAFGTAIGGWRQIRTLGGRIFRLRPVHGLASQLGSALVITVAAWLGGPVSTTQVTSSSILGAGAAERLGKVRWGVGREMLTAWLLTIPASAGMSALAWWILHLFAR